MLIIAGFKTMTKVLGYADAGCPHCGRRASQRVDRNRRVLSVFFVPLVPVGTSYVVTCSACGLSTRIDRDRAEGILAGRS